MTAPAFHLWDVYGVEMEYMIVDSQSLAVRPVTDQLMHSVAGDYVAEIEMGPLAWSNELALHVVELKTNGPVESLAPLADAFQQHVRQVNGLLQPMGAQLMPTAMHPWMDPEREMKLWQHEYNPVYEAYHRIFDCRGHGWANLQSTHLNLPFANDEEFGRLHAAIRLLLPLLPAVAASSPIVEGKVTGWADNRMEVYRQNSRRVPSVAGAVIPEPVFTRADYQREILQRMYDEIAPLDPEGTLQHEWLNSRGAIARFDRQAIEIRVLDVQECPAADLAICQLAVAVLRDLASERWSAVDEQQSVSVATLSQLFAETIRRGDEAAVSDTALLRHFGWSSGPCRAGDLWRQLVEQSAPELADNPSIHKILREGTLARRIQQALQQPPGAQPPGAQQPGAQQSGAQQPGAADVYRRLCGCLAEGQGFS